MFFPHLIVISLFLLSCFPQERRTTIRGQNTTIIQDGNTERSIRRSAPDENYSYVNTLSSTNVSVFYKSNLQTEPLSITVLKPEECLSLGTEDFKYVSLTAGDSQTGVCAPDCPPGRMGCKKCPSPGNYDIVLPSYGGFKTKKRTEDKPENCKSLNSLLP